MDNIQNFSLMSSLPSAVYETLFLSIKTVPGSPSFNDLDSVWKNLWTSKAKQFYPKNQSKIESDKSYLEKLYYEKSGLYAEFGKIVCISLGLINRSKDINSFEIISIACDTESLMLSALGHFLDNHPKLKYITGHNIIGFHIPFILRRMMKFGIKAPKLLDIHGKKPWEIKHVFDTMEFWKFNDFRKFTSFNLLKAFFEFPVKLDAPQKNTEYGIYWREHDMAKIRSLCEDEVKDIFRVFCSLKSINISYSEVVY